MILICILLDVYIFLIFVFISKTIITRICHVIKELVVALFGCTFYLTIGTNIIDFSWRSATGPVMCNVLGKALGSLSVIGAVVFFLDAIFSGLALHQCQTSTYRVQ